jgi:hypothetical protein
VEYPSKRSGFSLILRCCYAGKADFLFKIVQSQQTTVNQPAQAAERHKVWLWFNLLSLDAPLVAKLWQALFAHCFEVRVTGAAFAALAIAVWFIYVSDRLLDALRGDGDEAVPRHRFYQHNWSILGLSATFGLGVLGWICARLDPRVLHNGFAMLAAVLAYFAMVHTVPDAVRRFWPKELVVGVLFAMGTCLAPWTRTSAPGGEMLRPALLFAALCWLNCIAIEYWEWSRYGPAIDKTPHVLTLWIGRRLQWAALAICVFAATLAPGPDTGLRPLFFAALLSAAAILWLDHSRQRLSTEALRVLADVSLLSPLLVLLLPIFR